MHWDDIVPITLSCVVSQRQWDQWDDRVKVPSSEIWESCMDYKANGLWDSCIRCYVDKCPLDVLEMICQQHICCGITTCLAVRPLHSKHSLLCFWGDGKYVT